MKGFRGQYNTTIDKQVFAVLQRYYEAIETGKAHEIFPSLTCPIKEEDAERVVQAIDDEFSEETTRNYNYWCEYDALPDLSRLPASAKLALVEELKVILDPVGEENITIYRYSGPFIGDEDPVGGFF